MSQQQRIDVNRFFEWSKSYHFRQSCDPENRSREPKNSIIPNYSGFLPYIQSSALVGQSTSGLSKHAFGVSQGNTLKLASTGLNLARLKSGQLDPTFEASTYQYGVPTMPKPHPCMNFRTGSLETNHRFSYKNPQSQPQPTFRQGETVSKQDNVIRSGFTSNFLEFDGKGFPMLDVQENKRTQYRDAYNREIPFQRETIHYKPRYLPKVH